MNANELSDEVEMWGKDLLALNMKGGIPVIEGAKMLRQQADLIRNLQKSLGFKNSGYETINLTPQLELTDEEIKSEAKYFCNSWHSQNPERLVLFAKAILKKAQEKTIQSVMAENCTCYKLGYSPLNDYAAIKQK